MIRPPFPSVVDSTMLAAFRSCPQKFYRTYIEHWKPQAESVHLIAGAAFAKGIEAARRAYYEDGCSEADAIRIGHRALILAYGDFECPPESPKSLDRMLGALSYYFERYPLSTDGAIPITLPGGRRGIEFSFAEPLPCDNPETGDPILYTGRSDLIANFAGGVYIIDEKTTSSLGASWGRQWDLRSQFTGYCWAARELGLEPAGVVVRGVSILKTKYDTQQAITGRSAWMVDRWLKQVTHDIDRMYQCWSAGYWDFDLDHACTEYGGCTLRQICTSQNPDEWLPMYFTKRIWDPLAREERDIEAPTNGAQQP